MNTQPPVHPDLREDWGEYIGLSIAIVVGLGLLYLVLRVGSGLAAKYLPDRYEKAISISIKHFDSPKKNAKEFDQAKQIFSELLDFPRRRDLNFQLVYSKEPSPNAAAIPGGLVMLTSGLLDLIKSHNGLAFVIGHEIGHHQLRHVLRSAGTRIFLPVVMALVVGPTPFDQAFKLVELRHSRADELAADAFAFHLVTNRYQTSEGITEFFQKIKALRDGSDRVPQFLLTHPYPDERIKALEKLKRTAAP